jgi:hypothetical protein
MDPKSECEQALLQAILANLSREICQPLDLLQGGIGKLLDDPTRPINDAERGQAVTMLELCKDLGRLTRECLGTFESREGELSQP